MDGDGLGNWPGPATLARLARERDAGTWDSALTTAEFAAIRGVGLEPAGQVFGAAVHGVLAWVALSRVGCVAARPRDGGVAVSGPGGGGPFGSVAALVRGAWRTAVGRMAAECAALGAHGVVGASITASPAARSDELVPQTFSESAVVRARAVGTAVRAAGAPVPPRPFISGLSGQDFAKLIAAGWAPAGVVFGLSFGLGHLDDATVARSRLLAGNGELPAHTQVMNAARRDACARLEDEVRGLGGEGAVLSGMDVRSRVVACTTWNGRADQLVEVVMTGTAVVRCGAAPPRPTGLAVLPLRRRKSDESVQKESLNYR